MRYNLKRQKLSYDQWTSADPSTGINGANTFASKSGDDETGELFYGDSVNGFVVKERTSEDIYRLSTKTDVQAGTQTNVFIGGTENAPYIEPGSSSGAGVLPDDLIIFWDNETTTPGAFWTEITSTYEDMAVKVGAVSGVTTPEATHAHTVSGSLSGMSGDNVCTGDQGGGNNNDTIPGHTHTWTDTPTAVGTDPRHIRLRAFKSEGHLTETEFPVGAIIMYDQTEDPVGWQALDLSGSINGFYVKINSTNLNTPIAATHGHDYSATSTQSDSISGESSASGSPTGAAGTHTHTVSGSVDSADLTSWELDHTAIHF